VRSAWTDWKRPDKTVVPRLIPIFPAGGFTPHSEPAPDRIFANPKTVFMCPVTHRVGDAWEPRLARQRAEAERKRQQEEAALAAQEVADESAVVYSGPKSTAPGLKGGLG
jgi:hypothetical protein